MAEKQFSSGGVVFKADKGKIEVALIGRKKNAKVIWQIPKGLNEKGESLEETAKREVREEAGVDGEVIKKLGEISYWYYFEGKRTFKTVHFFLLRYLKGSTEEHDYEVDFARWFSIDEAETLLEYENERKIMRKAKKEIERLLRPKLDDFK